MNHQGDYIEKMILGTWRTVEWQHEWEPDGFQYLSLIIPQDAREPRMPLDVPIIDQALMSGDMVTLALRCQCGCGGSVSADVLVVDKGLVDDGTRRFWVVPTWRHTLPHSAKNREEIGGNRIRMHPAEVIATECWKNRQADD